jgi:hypothetical protein
MKAFELVRVLYSVAPVSFGLYFCLCAGVGASGAHDFFLKKKVHSQKSTLVSTFCAPQEVVTGKELTMHLVKGHPTSVIVSLYILKFFSCAYRKNGEVASRSSKEGKQTHVLPGAISCFFPASPYF